MAKDKEKKEKKDKKKDDAPAEEAPAAAAEEAAPTPSAAPAPKKVGNVFALFKQNQIQEFKEAFTMIDQDRDGIIGPDDLSNIFQQIGREADPKVVKEMLAESSEKLNFTHFLTLFGEKLHGTDTEGTLRDAFTLFDEDKSGFLAEEYVKDLLMNVGDQYNKDEIKQVWKEAPIEGGKFDYLKFVRFIKRGKEDE
jgi:Ca2+-binding EF-hand superfamily protein